MEGERQNPPLPPESEFAKIAWVCDYTPIQTPKMITCSFFCLKRANGPTVIWDLDEICGIGCLGSSVKVHQRKVVTEAATNWRGLCGWVGSSKLGSVSVEPYSVCEVTYFSPWSHLIWTCLLTKNMVICEAPDHLIVQLMLLQIWLQNVRVGVPAAVQAREVSSGIFSSQCDSIDRA